MSLICLSCPNCGNAFDVVAERRIFACGGCGRSWRTSCDGLDSVVGLLPIERQVVRPQLKTPELGSLVLLPFWRLAIRS
jgi:hypothetical protein